MRIRKNIMLLIIQFTLVFSEHLKNNGFNFIITTKFVW